MNCPHYGLSVISFMQMSGYIWLYTLLVTSHFHSDSFIKRFLRKLTVLFYVRDNYGAWTDLKCNVFDKSCHVHVFQQVRKSVQFRPGSTTVHFRDHIFQFLRTVHFQNETTTFTNVKRDCEKDEIKLNGPAKVNGLLKMSKKVSQNGRPRRWVWNELSRLHKPKDRKL